MFFTRTTQRTLLLSVLLAAGCTRGLRDPAEGLHEACSSNESCRSGQLCVRWADEASRMHQTCELLCDLGTGERQCPPPLTCVRVTDGPGTTCHAEVNE